jgi:hypothetical protein
MFEQLLSINNRAKKCSTQEIATKQAFISLNLLDLTIIEMIKPNRLLSLEYFSDFAAYIATFIGRTYFFGWKLFNKHIL